MMNWNNFEFYNSEFLWLLILIPIVAIWHFLMRKKDTATLTIPSIKGFEKTSFLSKFKVCLYVLRLFSLAAIIVALARPRNVSVSKKTKSNKFYNSQICFECHDRSASHPVHQSS